MADDLKPCPFCGSDMASFVPISEGCMRGTGALYVPCDCGACGPAGTNVNDAIAAWNHRAAPSSPVAYDGMPPLPDPDVIGYTCIGDNDAYSPTAVSQAQREAYEAGRIEGNRAREITETLCNPQWGEPDLYARLNRALSGEYALAQKHGKADVWPAAAHGLIDHLAGAQQPKPSPKDKS